LGRLHTHADGSVTLTCTDYSFYPQKSLMIQRYRSGVPDRERYIALGNDFLDGEYAIFYSDDLAVADDGTVYGFTTHSPEWGFGPLCMIEFPPQAADFTGGKVTHLPDLDKYADGKFTLIRGARMLDDGSIYFFHDFEAETIEEGRRVWLLNPDTGALTEAPFEAIDSYLSFFSGDKIYTYNTWTNSVVAMNIANGWNANLPETKILGSFGLPAGWMPDAGRYEDTPWIFAADSWYIY